MGLKGQEASPAARIMIVVDPGGNVGVESSVPSLIINLGILEAAKKALWSLTEQPRQKIVEPPVGLDGNSLRG